MDSAGFKASGADLPPDYPLPYSFTRAAGGDPRRGWCWKDFANHAVRI